MMSLWDALRMNMMISYQELVRTFLSFFGLNSAGFSDYPTINSDSDIGGLESCCE